MTVQPPRNFTHGEIRRWRRVGGLVLAEVVYKANQRIPRHLHTHARFVLVLKGALTEIRGDASQSHRSSTLLFRRADKLHAYGDLAGDRSCGVLRLRPMACAREHARADTQVGPYVGPAVAGHGQAEPPHLPTSAAWQAAHADVPRWSCAGRGGVRNAQKRQKAVN